MKERTIYLAGGCFWGLESLMQSLDGVIDAESGYANGKGKEYASYKTICQGGTGFRETVKVLYDEDKISLDAILFAYFHVVHPEEKNRQGADIGEQYQSGIYYIDDETEKTVRRIAEIERSRHSRFFTEIKKLENFYPAEEYHQNYLEKNPDGYCHIPFAKIRELSKSKIDPGRYIRPEDSEIREKLTAEEYRVTQESGTDRPFSNPYWNLEEKGIYVDKVTGEPLFSSEDKYLSSCGWPSFTRPIEEPVAVYNEDRSHGMIRTEVRSRAGNSHLGHVFEGDPESPTGTRFCINGSSLRFIPEDKLEEEGYGYLKKK